MIYIELWFVFIGTSQCQINSSTWKICICKLNLYNIHTASPPRVIRIRIFSGLMLMGSLGCLPKLRRYITLNLGQTRCKEQLGARGDVPDHYLCTDFFSILYEIRACYQYHKNVWNDFHAIFGKTMLELKGHKVVWRFLAHQQLGGDEFLGNIHLIYI